MLYSRHLWTMGIAILCLLGIILWETPQVVWTALADPQYATSPRTSVQRYWDMLDARQIDLARDLVDTGEENFEPEEFRTWEKMLKDDPYLTINKVEFLDTGNPQNIVVRVSWKSLSNSFESASYSFQLVETEQGWRIHQIRRIQNVSAAGGRKYGELLEA